MPDARRHRRDKHCSTKRVRDSSRHPSQVEESLIVSEIFRDVSAPLDMTEALTPQAGRAAPQVLPKSLLYSIFARIGGPGLDTDSFEALRASDRGNFLGKAIAYDNRQ